jgi:hypothetical protein
MPPRKPSRKVPGKPKSSPDEHFLDVAKRTPVADRSGSMGDSGLDSSEPPFAFVARVVEHQAGSMFISVRRNGQRMPVDSQAPSLAK